MRGPWRHFTDERGIASVMAIFIMVMLLVSGIFLVRMSSTEGDIAYGTMWAEGSFFAADAAINVGFDQVTPANTNPTAQSLNFTGVNLGAFNPSGTMAFTGTRPVPNSSMCSGTGYGSCGGYAYYDYAITGSGTGPKASQRTADARVSYGPVSQ